MALYIMWLVSDAVHIIGGRLFDPVHGADGAACDLWIHQGRVVDGAPQGAKVSTIDARGCVVMPGGVEMHAHIASMSVNAGRAIQSLSGYETVLPNAVETGRLYAKLGYTTAMEAAVAPGAAAHAHMQLDAMPNLDTGILVLMGNHEGIIQHADDGDRAGAVEMVRELLMEHRGFGIKAVNPAAVAAWRRDPAKSHIESIDDRVSGSKASPRVMLELFTEAQESLGLSHPTHIHGPQLGEPGNIDITLDLCRALDGRRFHLAHLQYYCYGKTKRGGFKSAVEQMLEWLADHPQTTADLGMVAFGPAFTATADLPLEHALYRHVGSPGKPACFLESGNEDCFGVMPLMHSAKNASHAMQWAVGLELALLWGNPWQYAMSIDHPNGGSFLNYPSLIAQLMSKARRDEQLALAHSAARRHTGLGAIGREMTLNEIAIITRASPAKALGLKNKGHLGIGADGDVTIYKDNTADPEAMFASPKWVIKQGRAVVADGAYQSDVGGGRLTAVF